MYGFVRKIPCAVCIGESSPWYIEVPPQDPDDNGGLYAVVPETIGEYIGKTDKNGRKMFVGDVVKATGDMDSLVGQIVFLEKDFWQYKIREENRMCAEINYHYKSFEVICNAHDDSEVIKKATLSVKIGCVIKSEDGYYVLQEDFFTRSTCVDDLIYSEMLEEPVSYEEVKATTAILKNGPVIAAVGKPFFLSENTEVKAIAWVKKTNRKEG